jgi:CheY-like chemotaxis protein
MHILLGDEPVLAPEAMYYQRLLAGEDDEARELVDKWLKEKNVIELYDEILVPAVGMAQHDLERNGLDEKQLQFILAATRDLVEDLYEEAQALPSLSQQATEKPSSERILCIPARDEADALIALMVAQVLRGHGYQVNTASPGSLKEIPEILGREKPAVLLISALPPFSVSRMRALCRRAKMQSPQTKIVLGLWGARLEESNLRERLGPECSEHVISLLSQTRGKMLGAPDVVCEKTTAENSLPESEPVADSD